MAKLRARSRKELCRFLSVKRGGLIAVMDDGTRLLRQPGRGWRLISKKKADFPLDEWIERKTTFYETRVPKWRKVTKLPSLKTIHKWMDWTDPKSWNCLSTLGEPCPYDHCDRVNNKVSWLVALRYVNPSTLIIEEMEKGENT